MLRRFLRWPFLLLVVGVLAAAGLAWWLLRPDPGDARLRAYVHAVPPVPIVFTSRSEPVSLQAAASPGEGYTSPGQGLWQAREGRLRLLTPSGAVHELTWGKPLPDGDALIDVMSPSVSFGGDKIVFAGRRAGCAGGRFRLYEIGVDGSGLRQLTGGDDDDGCTAAPPMRYGPSGEALDDAARRRTDYDDVDPTYLPGDAIAFVSSRIPDLGYGHARRSTAIWTMNLDGGNKRPLTANRNNDRWPFFGQNQFLCFSLWSRNREVISSDLRDLVRPGEGEETRTRPTDRWLGALVDANGARFGGLVKTLPPVWRMRPLFNGRYVFMTAGDGESAPPADDAGQRFRVVQAAASTIQSSPSATAEGRLPRQKGGLLFLGPARDAEGRGLSAATPGPCPPNLVVLAAAPLDEGGSAPQPARYGIYLARDAWESDLAAPVSPQTAELRLLFDDPDLVDAEPVAVYPRPSAEPRKDILASGSAPSSLDLADGRKYTGPMFQLENTQLTYNPQPIYGEVSDSGDSPLVNHPPSRLVRSLRFYAAERDRFDDPKAPRVPGRWVHVYDLPVNDNDQVKGWLPSGQPSVLVGLDQDGKIASWPGMAADSTGRKAQFFAFAGDHYSGMRPKSYHFCIGCHPGHTFLDDTVNHAEKVRP